MLRQKSRRGFLIFLIKALFDLKVSKKCFFFQKLICFDKYKTKQNKKQNKKTKQNNKTNQNKTKNKNKNKKQTKQKKRNKTKTKTQHKIVPYVYDIALNCKVYNTLEISLVLPLCLAVAMRQRTCFYRAFSLPQSA